MYERRKVKPKTNEDIDPQIHLRNRKLRSTFARTVYPSGLACELHILAH